MSGNSDYSYIRSLIAGGIAGITVDTTLFPFDTLKTRLQSPHGFFKAGGFHGLYKGIGPAFVGSAPTAALFFCSYDFVKKKLDLTFRPEHQTIAHMTAAASGEVVSCLVKVPTEILKQREQVGIYSSEILKSCKRIYRNEGIIGFYRGLWSTILREIPFSIIQFPLWEVLKVKAEKWKGEKLAVSDKALCGAVSGMIVLFEFFIFLQYILQQKYVLGGIAAGLTTPIDVAKTRIMLAKKTSNNLSLFVVLQRVYAEKGIHGLFAGFTPRVLWITMGGAIFFGSYELSSDVLNSLHNGLC